ncbi:CLUMA_CG000283, isoform A [Clunio marinus]|uniref:CLUMA_CG000283, isoform A n=1 Tax=Clunio marinus TaxID=568069 RepID=A0A1J1HGA1_9DIPT|nr:CLUMA_CG000283, isoform A [Clunio marinus]
MSSVLMMPCVNQGYCGEIFKRMQSMLSSAALFVALMGVFVCLTPLAKENLSLTNNFAPPLKSLLLNQGLGLRSHRDKDVNYLLNDFDSKVKLILQIMLIRSDM